MVVTRPAPIRQLGLALASIVFLSALAVQAAAGASSAPLGAFSTGAAPALREPSIVFSRSNYGPGGSGHFEIWVMDRSGEQQHRLTWDTRFYDEYPTWSPDGTKIAWVRFEITDIGYVGNIWVMNADGSEKHALTNFARTVESFVYGVTWSPDGRRLAFSLRDALWIMRSDGSRMRQVTPIGLGYEPDWAPQGGLIALVCRIPSYDICTVRTDGSGLRVLRRTEAEEAYPHWSRNGSRLTFGSLRCPGGMTCRNAVKVMASDGTWSREVFSAGFVDSPSWSGDGKLISTVGDTLYKFNLHGDQNLQPITDPSAPVHEYYTDVRY